MPEARGGPPQASAAPADSWGAEARGFFSLAGPMAVSRLGLAAMGVVDGVMLARFSTGQLAVHGLADALVGRAFEVCMALVLAGLALAAQARSGAAADQARVGTVWRHALLMAALTGGAGLLLGLAGGALLGLAGQPPALAQASGEVILVLCLGMLPALVALATAGLLEAVGRPAMVAVAIVLANLLNVLLNLWLIDGIGDGPPLGAVGVAWSTTGVRLLLALVLVAYLWRLPEHARFGIRAAPEQQAWGAWWAQGREQRLRGWSAGGTVGVLALLSLCLPIMAGWLGERAVAEMTALFIALAPCMVVAWGMADAAGLRVAAMAGQAGGSGALQRTGTRMATLAVAVLSAFGLVYLLAPRASVAWAAHEPGLVLGVASLLPLGFAAVAADGLSFLYGGALRSLGVLRQPFVVHLLAGLALLPLAWGLALGLQWGVTGLIAAHAATSAARALALAWMYQQCAGEADALSRPLPAVAPAAP